MSDILELVESTPKSRIAEEVNAMLAAYDQAVAECERLRAEVDTLKLGLIAVQNLIDQSEGVYGLHLNGDPAPWDELLEGGRYEDWLVDFSTALRGEGE